MVGQNGKPSQQSTPSQSLSVQRHSNKGKGIAKPLWERTLTEHFMQQQNTNKQISDALVAIPENANIVSLAPPKVEPAARDTTNSVPGNSGIRELLVGLGIGCSGTSGGGTGTGTSDPLSSIVEHFMKQFDKKLEERIARIPRAPPVVEEIDIERLSQTPWKPSAAPMPTPKNFRMPNLTMYDGTTDPWDHLAAYIVGIRGNDLTEAELESMLVKKFEVTLTKGALTWYTHLPEHSIGSFRELANAFMKAYAWLRT